MTQPKRKRHLKSIQVETDHRSYKTHTARLNAQTRASAWNSGQPWSGSEVSRMARCIEQDRSTFEMATELGRTLYSAMSVRAHLRFCMSHEEDIWGDRLRRKSRS